jgi:hypothetical protein
VIYCCSSFFGSYIWVRGGVFWGFRAVYLIARRPPWSLFSVSSRISKPKMTEGELNVDDIISRLLEGSFDGCRTTQHLTWPDEIFLGSELCFYVYYRVIC